MLRLTACALLLSTSAFAQDKGELCTVSAGIAGLAVAERAAGEAEDKTVKAITADLEGAQANYAAAVAPIVAWVFTLPEDQLTDEVATAYEAACLAQ